ncbi:rCG34470 [Rattus norvegicus]|uniref:RCG34470 n=1 Tax=Rattus norvegicus TaxID=10116 RepID=A6HJY5_RAT|nr:rCG34470 [Rattus norvegicus]
MFRNSLKMLLTGGKSSRKNRSSDGGSEEPPDRRQSSVDSRQSRSGPGGISTESDCAFEPDYAVPALPVSEGMQHIRIMEGVSRSLPSSPLLTHQSISVRLQPVKKLTGKEFT